MWAGRFHGPVAWKISPWAGDSRAEARQCEQAFFGAPLLASADLKHSQIEARWRALGMTLGGRAIYLVFTLRASKIRVLAARNMNRKERRDYEQAQARAEEDSNV